MGAIVAVIGLELVPVAAQMAGWIKPADWNSAQAWQADPKTVAVSVSTLLIIILGSVLFRGFMKIIPILIGFVAGYLLAWRLGIVDFSRVNAASMLEMPEFTAPKFDWASMIVIVPAALVVVAEHVGHLLVTSNMVGRDLSKARHRHQRHDVQVGPSGAQGHGARHGGGNRAQFAVQAVGAPEAEQRVTRPADKKAFRMHA
ncbi:solute carrier family 23 protein [uncultured Paenibacillus sp.]|uniref:solute carrier family 23 protein n=1 Tax=uncultured Paenibacillus sp. TaxID=227322 RepID=UPI0037DC8600